MNTATSAASATPKQKNIRVIPAKSQIVTEQSVTPVRKRVAAYCRVSTDTEEQLNSYRQQVETYTEQIQGHSDWIFAGIYADEGITGTSTQHRTKFNEMIADAKAGKIDYIITKAVSRFARNTLDCLNVVRELKAINVGVYFEKDGIDTFDSKSEVILTIISSIAQEESRNISENVKFGWRRRMESGKVSMAYGSFLGYRKGEDGEPEIIPEEAEVVRLIYKLFLDGKTPNAIAKHLEAQDIKSPRGLAKWSTTTIRSILTNEKYMGDAILQKTYSVDFLSKKRIVNDDAIRKIEIQNSHPAIVSEEVFSVVQTEIKRRERGGRTSHSGHPFASKLYCADCGCAFGSKVWHSNTQYRKVVWRCNGKYKEKGADPCATPNLDESVIQQAFIDTFNGIFDQKETLIHAMECVVASIMETDEINALIERLQAENDEREAELRILVRQRTSEEIVPEENLRRYEELCGPFEETRKRIKQLRDDRVHGTSRKEQINQFISSLREHDKPLTAFDADLWNAIVDHGTVHPNRIVFTLKNGTEAECEI